MGLRGWLKRLDPDKKDAITLLAVSLGALFGHGDRATAIVGLLNEYPGRVDAFQQLRERVSHAADILEDAEDEATREQVASNMDPLTADEIEALDDVLDFGSWSTRALRKAVKRIR